MTGGLPGGTLDRGDCLRPRSFVRAMVVLAVSVIAACGTMNVQVDVIDPAYVETVAQQTQLQSQLREAFRPAEEKEARYRQIQNDLNRLLLQEVEAYRREGTPQAKDSAEALKQSIPLIVGEFTQLVGNLKALDQQIRHELAQQGVGADVTSPRLSSLLVQRQATAEAGVTEVLQLLEDLATSPEAPTLRIGPARAAAIGSPMRARLEANLRTITGGLTLTESAHAYAVASAPKEKWAPKYNRTFGRGTFGNLNFAVKMVDLADFTIKGVSFDPSKVAQVASKVTTQSLLLAAQIAGVPVGGLSPGSTDAGSALAAQSAALAPVLESNQRFAAQENLRQEAIAAVLTRIAQESNNLSSEDVDIRSEAHRAIRATYDAHKGLLQFPSQ